MLGVLALCQHLPMLRSFSYLNCKQLGAPAMQLCLQLLRENGFRSEEVKAAAWDGHEQSWLSASLENSLFRRSLFDTACYGVKAQLHLFGRSV